MNRYARNPVEVNLQAGHVLLVVSTVHAVVLQQLQVVVLVALLAQPSPHRKPPLLRAGK